jgi:transcriptional regulator with XRE-family HTH domain
VATSERRVDRGREQADRIARLSGAEIRMSRRGAGVSVRAAADSVGMSESMFGRIERGRLANVSVVQIATACAAVGLKFSARPYPDADPIRDAGQTRLLERLRGQLPTSATWRTEVPMPTPGDFRAWDAVCTLDRVKVAIEAEVRLTDMQALDRKIALKRRDSGIGLVILLVADTAGNRRLLAHHREALRANFPLDTRAVLAALRAGLPPRASGIVLI